MKKMEKGKHCALFGYARLMLLIMVLSTWVTSVQLQTESEAERFLKKPFLTKSLSITGLLSELGLDPSREWSTCKNGLKCGVKITTYADGLKEIGIGFDEPQEPYHSLLVYGFGDTIIKAKFLRTYDKVVNPGYQDTTLLFDKKAFAAFKDHWAEFKAEMSRKAPYLPPLNIEFANRDEFVYLLHESNDGEFGYFCGNAGIAPMKRQCIMKLFDRKEYVGIRYLLLSSNQVSRMYAAEALIQLQSEGYKVTAQERAAIRLMSQETAKIPICLGCSYSDTTLAEAFTVASQYSLRELLKEYKKLGYLRGVTIYDYRRP
jgi:hypothetical protein